MHDILGKRKDLKEKKSVQSRKGNLLFLLDDVYMKVIPVQVLKFLHLKLTKDILLLPSLLKGSLLLYQCHLDLHPLWLQYCLFLPCIVHHSFLFHNLMLFVGL